MLDSPLRLNLNVTYLPQHPKNLVYNVSPPAVTLDFLNSWSGGGGAALQGPRAHSLYIPGSRHLHPHFLLSLGIFSLFWGPLQPHLHHLLVPLLPVSEMNNLQNQKRKTRPQNYDPVTFPFTQVSAMTA